MIHHVAGLLCAVVFGLLRSFSAGPRNRSPTPRDSVRHNRRCWGTPSIVDDPVKLHPASPLFRSQRCPSSKSLPFFAGASEPAAGAPPFCFPPPFLLGLGAAASVMTTSDASAMVPPCGAANSNPRTPSCAALGTEQRAPGFPRQSNGACGAAGPAWRQPEPRTAYPPVFGSIVEPLAGVTGRRFLPRYSLSLNAPEVVVMAEDDQAAQVCSSDVLSGPLVLSCAAAAG